MKKHLLILLWIYVCPLLAQVQISDIATSIPTFDHVQSGFTIYDDVPYFISVNRHGIYVHEVGENGEYILINTITEKPPFYIKRSSNFSQSNSGLNVYGKHLIGLYKNTIWVFDIISGNTIHKKTLPNNFDINANDLVMDNDHIAFTSSSSSVIQAHIYYLHDKKLYSSNIYPHSTDIHFSKRHTYVIHSHLEILDETLTPTLPSPIPLDDIDDYKLIPDIEDCFFYGVKDNSLTLYKGGDIVELTCFSHSDVAIYSALYHDGIFYVSGMWSDGLEYTKAYDVSTCAEILNIDKSWWINRIKGKPTQYILLTYISQEPNEFQYLIVDAHTYDIHDPDIPAKNSLYGIASQNANSLYLISGRKLYSFGNNEAIDILRINTSTWETTIVNQELDIIYSFVFLGESFCNGTLPFITTTVIDHINYTINENNEIEGPTYFIDAEDPFYPVGLSHGNDVLSTDNNVIFNYNQSGYYIKNETVNEVIPFSKSHFLPYEGNIYTVNITDNIATISMLDTMGNVNTVQMESNENPYSIGTTSNAIIFSDGTIFTPQSSDIQKILSFSGSYFTKPIAINHDWILFNESDFSNSYYTYNTVSEDIVKVNLDTVTIGSAMPWKEEGFIIYGLGNDTSTDQNIVVIDSPSGEATPPHTVSYTRPYNTSHTFNLDLFSIDIVPSKDTSIIIMSGNNSVQSFPVENINTSYSKPLSVYPFENYILMETTTRTGKSLWKITEQGPSLFNEYDHDISITDIITKNNEVILIKNDKSAGKAVVSRHSVEGVELESKYFDSQQQSKVYDRIGKIRNDAYLYNFDDGIRGRELYVFDTESLEFLLQSDIIAGPEGSNPRFLAQTSHSLYFTAGDGSRKRQIYTMEKEDLGTSLPPMDTPTPLDIYPNPSHDYIILSEPVLEYSICDMSGKTILTEKNVTDIINIESVTAGSYILNTTDSSGKIHSSVFVKM